MHHSSASWEITLVYVLAETLYALDKRSSSKWKMSDFRLLTWNFTKLCFNRLLLLKVYKILAKNCREVMFHVTDEWCKIGRKTNLFQKWQESYQFWPEHSKSQNLHFDWFLLCNIYNFWPKKLQRNYLSWHWGVMKSLKKNWLVVWKMTWEIWQMFTRPLESLKIRTLMGSFYPK